MKTTRVASPVSVPIHLNQLTVVLQVWQPYCCVTNPKIVTVQQHGSVLTLLHSERPKLYAILASLSAVGLTIKTVAKVKGLHKLSLL